MKFSFWGSLYLPSNSNLLLSQEIQSKRQERKRRTTANPVYSGAVFEPEVFLARTWPSPLCSSFIYDFFHLLPSEKPAEEQYPDYTWPALWNDGFFSGQSYCFIYIIHCFPLRFFPKLEEIQTYLKNLTHRGLNTAVIRSRCRPLWNILFSQSQVDILKPISPETLGDSHSLAGVLAGVLCAAIAYTGIGRNHAIQLVTFPSSILKA